MKLKTIATEIKAGYTFRGRILNENEADTAIIQLKDICEDYCCITNTSTWIRGDRFKQNHFLQGGDVLFIAKGLKNYAIVFESNYKAIATSVFFIIKIKENIVLPKYLAWYINSTKAQNYLASLKYGTSTLNINKRALEDMEIEIPSIVVQEEIIQISKLSDIEQKILSEIKEKRKALMGQLLINKINN